MSATLPSEGFGGEGLPQAVLTDSSMGGGFTQETYDITLPGDENVQMRGRVAVGDTATTFLVLEPKRTDATDLDRSSGGDATGNGTQVIMKVECYHGSDDGPGPETRATVLGHLGAAMMALKFEE